MCSMSKQLFGSLKPLVHHPWLGDYDGWTYGLAYLVGCSSSFMRLIACAVHQECATAGTKLLPAEAAEHGIFITSSITTCSEAIATLGAEGITN